MATVDEVPEAASKEPGTGRGLPSVSLKSPYGRLRERILESALDSCDPDGTPDAKRTQEWLIALQYLEQAETLKKADGAIPAESEPETQAP